MVEVEVEVPVEKSSLLVTSAWLGDCVTFTSSVTIWVTTLQEEEDYFNCI